jgi:hypothetical protein
MKLHGTFCKKESKPSTSDRKPRDTQRQPTNVLRPAQGQFHLTFKTGEDYKLR